MKTELSNPQADNPTNGITKISGHSICCSISGIWFVFISVNCSIAPKHSAIGWNQINPEMAANEFIPK